jgi:hypothetical protein
VKRELQGPVKEKPIKLEDADDNDDLLELEEILRSAGKKM